MHCPQRPKRSWAFFLVILRFVLSCPFFNFFGLCICFCVCAVLKSLNCLVGLEFVWLGLFSEMGFWNSSHVLDSMWDNVELYCWVFAEFVNENCTFCCLAGKKLHKKRRENYFWYIWEHDCKWSGERFGLLGSSNSSSVLIPIYACMEF